MRGFVCALTVSAALTTMAATPGDGYLPRIGPGALRFRSPAPPLSALALPPLSMGNEEELAAKTAGEAAKTGELASAPAPAQLAGPPAPPAPPVPGAPATNAVSVAALTTAPAGINLVAGFANPVFPQATPEANASPLISAQMFVPFFSQGGGVTNRITTVITPAVFSPAAPPPAASSTATYTSQ